MNHSNTMQFVFVTCILMTDNSLDFKGYLLSLTSSLCIYAFLSKNAL